MECNCFEKILGIGDTERISYQEVINKSVAIKNKLIQKRVRNPQPILESALLARQGLLWKMFHTKTDLIKKPDMEHSCQLFMRHRDILRELFNKPPVRTEPIIIPSSPIKRITTKNQVTRNNDTGNEAQWQRTIAPPMTPPGSPPADSNNWNLSLSLTGDDDRMRCSTPVHTTQESEKEDQNNDEENNEGTNEREENQMATSEISCINENEGPLMIDITDNSEQQTGALNNPNDPVETTTNPSTPSIATGNSATSNKQATRDCTEIPNTSNSTDSKQAEESEETFRHQVEHISKHFYRPKGTTFRVTWAGYDLAPMEEPLSTVLKLGEGALKDYLKRCSKRALTTLLKRHPEVGLVTKKSANKPKV